MRIENHRLVTSDDRPPIPFVPDDHGGPLVPEIVVIHYAVTASAKATAAVLKAKDYVSCHLSIDRSGAVIQQVPFDRVAYHAGASSWQGRTDCNRFSLGIEIGNPGPVLRDVNDNFFTTYGSRWTHPVLRADHKSGSRTYRWWAEYGDTELDLCVELCELFRQEYGIKAIVGHDDIAPRRKLDPGPAFPMAWLQETVFPTGSNA